MLPRNQSLLPVFSAEPYYALNRENNLGILLDRDALKSMDSDGNKPNSQTPKINPKGCFKNGTYQQNNSYSRSKSMQKQNSQLPDSADKENWNNLNRGHREITPFQEKYQHGQYSPGSACNGLGSHEQYDTIDYSVRVAQIFARISNLIVLSSDENRDEALEEIKSLKQQADILKSQLEKICSLKSCLNSSSHPSEHSDPISALIRTIESSVVLSWFPSASIVDFRQDQPETEQRLDLQLENAYQNARALTVSPLTRLKEVVSLHSQKDLERTVVQGRVQGIEALIQDFEQANLHSEKTLHVALFDFRKTP